MEIAYALCRVEQLRPPAVHRSAMTAIDFEKQPILGLEMIGHTAGICAGGLRNVPHRYGIEAIGRKQLFRRAQDRLAQARLARGSLIAVGLADHSSWTNVQINRSRQQISDVPGDDVAGTFSSALTPVPARGSRAPAVLVNQTLSRG